MKNKKTLFGAIFIAIIIYVCIVKVSDMALDSSQASHFDTASESYIKLNKETKVVKKILLQENDIKIHTLDINKTYPNKVTDLWNKKIIKPDGKVSRTVNLSSRNFYKAKQINDSTYLILSHHSKRLWNHHLAYFSLLSIIYFLVAVILIRLIYSRQVKRDYEISLITQNLKKIQNGQEISPMVIRSHDFFTPVVKEIQSLNTFANEKRQYEHLLSRRFKGLVGHLPVGVMLLDDKGNVIMHNQAMSVILGQNISEGKHPFIDDIKTYSLSRMIEQTLKKNKNHHKNLELIDNNKFVDANVIRIAHSDEDIERQVIVILYDLTEFKQIEQMQGDFVSNVSHELKTPITAITGFSETLLNGAKNNPDDLDKFLKIINKESIRLNSLVQDILELSQVDEVETFNDEISLDEIVNDITDELSSSISSKNLTVNKKITGPDLVVSSSLLIEQIINNLVTNSVIYNNMNGQVDIKLKHDEIKNQLLINISDTGIGISDENIDRIFERFYRVDKSHSQEIEGTGLGLSIVIDAVNKLNGTIKVESQLTVGTKFEVKIPL
ncbi:sensor histidine kinase [Companilactobacillus sp. DQM5]|uniref:sensor histidine kinase n=1 Tax=Companilactobacillus sp. DQM5 TaxID=3463359 RepID=UPI00405848A7